MEKKTFKETMYEIEKNLPEIVAKLEPSKIKVWGETTKLRVDDIAYLETEKYKIAAAKQKQCSWYDSEIPGQSGEEWKEWISVYYKEKGLEAKIKKLETKKIETRHRSNPDYDREELWDYWFVKIRELEPSKVVVAWANGEGKEGLTYELDLE